MLEMQLDVMRGVLFIRLEGSLTLHTFSDFDKELNHFLYQHGMHYFVFNFLDLKKIDPNIFVRLQNKLFEIFLSCGNVVMCGLSELYQHCLGTQEKLFYVNHESEAFQYFSI